MSTVDVQGDIRDDASSYKQPQRDDMKFTLTFATRYNGVYCTPNEDIADEALLEQVEKVCDDEISMVFPEYTYEMCDKFDHALTSKQIDELCEKAAVHSPSVDS
jgi:hypothetical protein